MQTVQAVASSMCTVFQLSRDRLLRSYEQPSSSRPFGRMISSQGIAGKCSLTQTTPKCCSAEKKT